MEGLMGIDGWFKGEQMDGLMEIDKTQMDGWLLGWSETGQPMSECYEEQRIR